MLPIIVGNALRYIGQRINKISAIILISKAPYRTVVPLFSVGYFHIFVKEASNEAAK